MPRATDNIIFDWVISMLNREPSARPTAGKLVEGIAAESAARGILFCGPCC